MGVFLSIVFLAITIHYRNSTRSLVTGVICVLFLIHSFFKWLNRPDIENKESTRISDDIYNESEYSHISPKENSFAYSHSAKQTSILSKDRTNDMCSKQEYDDLAFKDIEYRALNKLKNSHIQDTFSGLLSLEIDRKEFCKLCLSKELIRYSNAEEDKKLITVNECKDFLRSNSMKVSGKKAELIQRIDIFSPDFFGKKYYIVTDKGMSFLHRHWEQRTLDNFKTDQDIHCLKLNKYHISESEFNDFKRDLPFAPFDNDVIWGILNDRTLKYSYSASYSDLRENYLNMALLLEEEQHRERALEYFLMVICFDINGYSSLGKPELIQGIAERIYRSRIYYSEDIAVVAYSQSQINKSYFSEDMFLSLVNDIVSSESHISYEQTKDILSAYLFR